MKRIAFVLVALSGCATPRPAATPPPVACADVVATGDPDADVARLAAACGSGMSTVGDVHGEQGETDPSRRVSLVVHGSRRCFRVVAAGDTGITELDAQILGPGGRPLARDGRSGPLAVVPEGSLLCLPHDGEYTVEIAVTHGRGSFAARVLAGR